MEIFLCVRICTVDAYIICFENFEPRIFATACFWRFAGAPAILWSAVGYLRFAFLNGDGVVAAFGVGNMRFQTLDATQITVVTEQKD